MHRKCDRGESLRPTLLILSLLCFVLSPRLAGAQTTPPSSARATLRFDQNWRFFKGDAPGAEQPSFDDSTWRPVSLPHDWSIDGPFDAAAPAGGSGAFLPTGIGWYRKSFILPAADADRSVWVEFDGVMANSDVWINGVKLGHRPSGYVGLVYDLTASLHRGANAAPNILAVRCDNSAQPASRWYPGAGIYRHVRLVIADPLHIEPDSVFVTTPAVAADHATVHVQARVDNASRAVGQAALQITLLGPSGNTVATASAPAQRVAAGQPADFAADLAVAHPELWDLDHPALYRAIVRVVGMRRALDDTAVPFGIREFHFDPATGFWLNGRNHKLKGVCLHGDAGALGTAVPLSVWERRLTALKEIGCNAIRTSHNPPTPEFLDLCDRLGLVVMDEMFDCWLVGKRPADYHLYFKQWAETDCRDAVRRDRNHPCIVLWSAGNEIHDTPDATSAKAILASLLTVLHENDPTRPVTQALFRPNASHDYQDGLADMLDVVGQNYREQELVAAHDAKLTRKIVGTENGHDRRAWLTVRDTPAFAGEFLWTGFDYLGEARAWPTIGSASGLFDRTGDPRPLAWERASWWSETPVVHIVRRVGSARATPSDPGFEPLAQRSPTLADWSPANLAPHSEHVEVYSNAATVELFLNDRSLGAKPLNADATARTWLTPFAPGVLRAVARDFTEKIVATDTLRTAGPPAQIVLTADRSSVSSAFDDVVYIRATIADASGVPIPNAADLVTFQITGPATLVAVDNGDNSSHEPFHAAARTAYNGRCLAIVRGTGQSGAVIVTATTPSGLTGSVRLAAAAAPPSTP